MLQTFFSKRAKTGVFMHFFEKFVQKIVFFLARLPHLNQCILAQRYFQKNFKTSHSKRISQNSTKGRPFRSAGGRIPEEKRRPPHPTPPSLIRYCILYFSSGELKRTAKLFQIELRQLIGLINSMYVSKFRI